MGNGKPRNDTREQRQKAAWKRADTRFQAAFLSAPSYAVMAV